MARIKYVLNERRIAYEGAVELHANERAMELAKKWIAKEDRKRTEEQAIAAKQKEEEKVESEEGKAAELAASGLFDSPAVPETTSSKISS